MRADRPSKSEAACPGKPALTHPQAGDGEPSGCSQGRNHLPFLGQKLRLRWIYLQPPGLLGSSVPPPLPGRLLLAPMADCLAWPLAGVPRLPVPHPMLCSFTQFKPHLPVRGRAMGAGHAGTDPAPQIWIQFQGALGTSLASGLLISLSFKARLLHPPFLPRVQGGRPGSSTHRPPTVGQAPRLVSPKCSLPPFPGEAGSILIPVPGGGQPGSERAVAWREGRGCLCLAFHCVWHLAWCLARSRYSGAIPGRRERLGVLEATQDGEGLGSEVGPG